MSHSVRSRALSDARGQAVAEFAVVLPLVLLIFLGLVELGNALGVSSTLARASREGASIAFRGSSLDTVAIAVMRVGEEIDLAERGGTVVSRIEMRDDGPRIIRQLATEGFTGASRLGEEGEGAAQLADMGLEDGSTHYVVEVFYRYPAVTPLSRVFSLVLPDPLYERAVF